MNRFPLLRRILALTLIALILGTTVVQAGAQPNPTQPAGWVSFDGRSSPQAASLVLLDVKSGALQLRASVPGAWAGSLSLQGTSYAVLQNDGLVTGHTPGLPDLPVLRQMVEIPFGAEYSLQVTAARSRTVSLAGLGLPAVYYPAQPSQPKCGPALPPCPPDAKIYAGSASYPAENVRVVEEFVQRGHRILTLEVWPVSYSPAAGSLRLFSDIQFSILLKGGDAALTRQMAQRYASVDFERSLAASVLNYNQGAGAQSVQQAPVYLIITADIYDTPDLAAFVALKQSQGFQVSLVRQSEIANGSTAAGIKAYIQTAYDTWTEPPSYLLLVGDSDRIPVWPFQSSGESEYSTDLYYATLQGSDYVPEIYRGRFPVRSAAQLTNMVNNALWYENTSGAEAWVKKAAFLATDDSGNYTTAEGTHNYVISSYTQPKGYTGIFPLALQPGGDKLYAITHDADTTDVLRSINDDRVMVIYSGHGGSTSWAGPAVSQSNVRGLTGVLSAYVAGHACVTADFNTPEAFSDTWVIQPGKGALVYVGASDNSYWDEDDVLERKTFDSLYADPLAVPTINAMLYDGLNAVQRAFPASARYYWEEYNLFGDPGAVIVLGPKQPDFTLSLSAERVGLCGPGSAELSADVGSINDYVTPVDLSLSGAPSGVTAAFDPASVTPAGASLLTLISDGSPAAGSYPLSVTGTSGSLLHSSDLSLSIFTSVPAAPAPASPADGAANQPVLPTFSWGAVEQSNGYQLQVARDAGFSDLVLDQTAIQGTSFTLASELQTSTTYYWRVQTGNTCGVGQFSPVFSFTTLPAPGDCGPGYAPQVLHEVDFESGAGGWQDASTSTYRWALNTAQAHSPSHAQFAADVSTIADQRLVSPVISLPADGGQPLSLSYWNRYSFESTSTCYDAGLLEISVNGGAWTQVPSAQLLTQPYNGTVSSSYSNPLAGKSAWCFSQPAWTRSVVDLDDYAGKTVQFRFRQGSDTGIGAEGWYIDDARVQSCQSTTPQYGLTLTGAQTSASGKPGSTVDYSLTLTNTGNRSDTFTFSSSGGTWTANLPADVTLSAGASQPVTVSVTIPAGASAPDSLRVTATSSADPAQSAWLDLTTGVLLYDLTLSAAQTAGSVRPGASLEYSLTLTNTGNTPDSFSLSLSLNQWSVSLPSGFSLDAGQSQQFTVSVSPPAGATGSDVARITAVSSAEPLRTASLDLTTHMNYPLYLPVLWR